MSRSQVSGNRSNFSRMFNDADELSDEELVKQVNAVKEDVRILTIENEIIEKTLMRQEPGLLHGLQQAYEYAVKLHSSGSLGVGSFVKSKSSAFGFADSLTSPSRMLTSPSRISTRRVESSAKLGGTVVLGSGQRVNIMERSELVSAEIEIVIKVLEKARKKGAKQQALLKAQLEEISLREVDFERATVDFNKQVIVEGWDKIAQRIPAEIWIRYMTEWVKICDSQIGKLRLRTSTLNTQFHKLNGQIRVKAELSESLRPVDFEKLEIENNICLDIIDQKIFHLVGLKKMTGEANLNLTIHKKAMTEQNNYLSYILKTIKHKQKWMTELIKEAEVIHTQADFYQKKLDGVRELRNAYEVPDIMDYVMVKSEVGDLKHAIKVLENRIHIQNIALTSLNRKIKSMRFLHE